MKQGIFILAKHLRKRHLLPWNVWSFIYDRLHKAVDKDRLW